MPDVTIAWDESNTDETGHKIYRSTAAIDPADPLASPGVLVTTIAGSKDGSGTYLDTGVTHGLTYYRVSALRASDSSEAFSPQQSINVSFSGPWPLDDAENFVVGVSPAAHFDASKMDGTNNDDWADGETVELGTKAGGANAFWVDRTNQFSMGTASATTQPVFETDGMSGSEPWVNFQTNKVGSFYDPSGIALKRLDLTAAGGTTIFLVGMQTSTTTGYPLQGSVGGTEYYYHPQMYVGSYAAFRSYGSGVTPDMNAQVTITGLTDKYYILSCIATESDDSVVSFQMEDEAPASITRTADTVLGDAQAVKLDKASYFTGYIAEMIFFDTSISDDDRDIVEAYLQDKYSFAT